ncbi:MAG TPA: carboxypeptidase-like regulatory domain-containing protein [Chitinophagaceae bacterium]
MKRLLFTLTALFGLAILSFSQNVKLTGKILNKKNDPVVGATIQIEGSTTGTTSDVDGIFSISLSVGKKHTIVISSVNYETKTISDVEVIAGQVNELQILLNESAKNTLTGVTVTASSS